MKGIDKIAAFERVEAERLRLHAENARLRDALAGARSFMADVGQMDTPDYPYMQAVCAALAPAPPTGEAGTKRCECMDKASLGNRATGDPDCSACGGSGRVPA